MLYVIVGQPLLFIIEIEDAASHSLLDNRLALLLLPFPPIIVVMAERWDIFRWLRCQLVGRTVFPLELGRGAFGFHSRRVALRYLNRLWSRLLLILVLLVTVAVDACSGETPLQLLADLLPAIAESCLG